MMKTFEELEVYRKAFDFAVTIFEITKEKRMNKNIAHQLERAALSISNNIAEGFELQSNKQFIRFLYIAKGSCGESRNLLKIADRLAYINEQHCQYLITEAVEISQQLSNFIKYLEKSEIR